MSFVTKIANGFRELCRIFITIQPRNRNRGVSLVTQELIFFLKKKLSYKHAKNLTEDPPSSRNVNLALISKNILT